MSDFEYDCMKKKQLAGQAKYRKRGSKSKKCTLPSDGMTQKQWKERCGPVITYNPNKPMIWADFKNLPVHIQAEYITNLQKKFGATAVDLGGMFGVRALTVRKHVDANNLAIDFPRGHAMSAASRAEWTKFLREENDAVHVFVSADTQESIEHVVENTEDNAENIEQAGEFETRSNDVLMHLEPKAMSMRKFSLQFSGVIDVNMIANSLKLILGDKSEGELEIIGSLI